MERGMPTMLWRSKEAEHVTLLGSMHVLDGRPLPEWAIEACDAADLVVFESDFSNFPGFPELPRAQTLFTLSPRVARAALKEAARLGIKERVERLYPFATSMLLGVCGMPKDLQFGRGPDAILLERARRHDVLETIEEHFLLVYKEPPLAEQIVALERGIEERKAFPHRLRDAATAWRRGDVDAVCSAIKLPQMAVELPNIFAGMFTKRNRLWAPRAAAFIEETKQAGETLLIVVGCGHLAGPESFPAALALLGYHFTQC